MNSIYKYSNYKSSILPTISIHRISCSICMSTQVFKIQEFHLLCIPEDLYSLNSMLYINSKCSNSKNSIFYKYSIDEYSKYKDFYVPSITTVRTLSHIPVDNTQPSTLLVPFPRSCFHLL